MNYKNKCLFIFLFLICAVQACQEQVSNNQIDTAKTQEIEKQERLLRHVVVFKFNDDSSEEDVNRLNQSFNKLAEEISVVKDFEWGINNSPENLHQGFTHCYLLSFGSEAERDSVYLPHPKHQEFVKSLQPHLEKVFVVDYWAN